MKTRRLVTVRQRLTNHMPRSMRSCRRIQSTSDALTSAFAALNARIHQIGKRSDRPQLRDRSADQANVALRARGLNNPAAAPIAR